MKDTHSHNVGKIDPNHIRINFSKGVQGAFADLAAAMHFSETFDPDLLSLVRDLSQGKSPSVFEVIFNLPLIAEGVYEHAHATGDKKAVKAWLEISSEVLERGFTLEEKREIAR